MSIIGGLDVHRAQITFDWVDRDSGETTGVGSRQRPGWGCAAGWGSCPGSRAGSRWRAAPAGGLWSRSSRRPGWPPPGRAGRDQQPARPQAAGQDRPYRRPAAARVARAGPAAQLLDPADLDPGSADHRAAAQDPGRPADRLAAAHPRRAVPSRLPRPAQELLSQASRGWLAGWRCRRPAGSCLGRAGPDRRAGCRAGPDRPVAAYLARRQPGCRALMTRHDGIGASTAPTILAELGEPAGSPAAARWCGPPGWTSPCPPLMAGAAPGSCPARARRCCAGRCLRRPRPPPGPAPLTRLLPAGQGPPGRQPGHLGGRPQAGPAGAPHLVRLGDTALARSRTCPWLRWPDRGWCVPCPQASRCAAASAREPPAATAGPWTAPKTARPRTTGHPSIILSPDPGGSAHQIRLGARAHTPFTTTAVRR
jgi:hypothetical protein